MDPYRTMKERPLCRKADVAGELVVIFGNKREDRGLELIWPFTRAVKRSDLHELIITDEENVRPGTRVDRIAYLGFIEIHQGGVIMYGDKLVVGDRVVGELVGFEESHMPNHINIILYDPNRLTGFEMGVQVGQKAVFTDNLSKADET